MVDGKQSCADHDDGAITDELTEFTDVIHRRSFWYKRYGLNKPLMVWGPTEWLSGGAAGGVSTGAGVGPLLVGCCLFINLPNDPINNNIIGKTPRNIRLKASFSCFTKMAMPESDWNGITSEAY